MTVLIDKFCLTKDQNVKPYFRDGSYKVQYITETFHDSTVQLVLMTLDTDAVLELQRAERITVKYKDTFYNITISEISKISEDNGKYVITISGLVNDTHPISFVSIESSKDPRYEKLLVEHRAVLRERDKLRDEFVAVCRDRDDIQKCLDLALYKGHRYW